MVIPVMSALNLRLQSKSDRLEKRADKELPFLIHLIVVVSLLAVLNTTEQLDPIRFNYVRYFAILPVVSVAFYFGVSEGLAVATFFGLIFVIEAIWLISQVGYTANTFELIALILLLEILAMVVGDLTSSLRQRSILRRSVQARENLMSRTSNLKELTQYLMEAARWQVNAQRADLILRNPVNDQWQLFSNDDQRFLRRNPLEGEPILAEWLLAQENPVILNNLDGPTSPFVEEDNGQFRLESLLSRKLVNSDGSDMGRLILVNKDNGYFLPEDLEKLDDLISASEKALEQARQYARTDYNLERRVNQLATIQRTSQELNATLDAEKVVDLTLDVALELTQAESGVILLNFKDLVRMLRTRGGGREARDARLKLEAALKEGSLHALKITDLHFPMFFNNSKSQLASFISHSDNVLGMVVVESQRDEAFDQTTQWVLNLLADHAAISLANARLFQEIQKEKQHAAMIIEGVTNGLLTTDRTGQILTANPAAEEQTGWKMPEMIGLKLSTAFGLESDDEQKLNQVFADAVVQQRSFTLEPLEIFTRQGARRVISLTGSPVYETGPEPFGMVILVRDLTEREEFNRLQEELISSISHEMRTPLAKISSISEMISNDLNQDTARKYTRFLDVLTNESQRLAGFLDRILDVHQLETHQFDIQLRPLPLKFMAESLVEEWRIIAPRRQINMVAPEAEVWVVADENALHSVLSNLIDNAVTYSGDDSSIQVCIERMSGSEAKISVCDNGPGIPAEYHQRLFERFFRLNGNDSQVVYGHGIGLYVTKILVDAMGGRIWVESQPEQGSRFIFTLPIQEDLTNVT